MFSLRLRGAHAALSEIQPGWSSHTCLDRPPGVARFGRFSWLLDVNGTAPIPTRTRAEHPPLPAIDGVRIACVKLRVETDTKLTRAWRWRFDGRACMCVRVYR